MEFAKFEGKSRAGLRAGGDEIKKRQLMRLPDRKD
jgi:hypothetical protein